jgi:hypothetical protein
VEKDNPVIVRASVDGIKIAVKLINTVMYCTMFKPSEAAG